MAWLRAAGVRLEGWPLQCWPLQDRSRSPQAGETKAAGFTLLELLVVIGILGILAAIAAPTAIATLNNHRVNTAGDLARQALRQAQNQAHQQRRKWEVCFRDHQGQVQYSIHPTDRQPHCRNATWQTLGGETALARQVAIDPSATTFYRTANGYRAQFQPGMDANGRLGRITWMVRDRPDTSPRSCVFVSTLLGAMRMDADEDCLRR